MGKCCGKTNGRYPIDNDFMLRPKTQRASLYQSTMDNDTIHHPPEVLCSQTFIKCPEKLDFDYKSFSYPGYAFYGNHKLKQPFGKGLLIAPLFKIISDFKYSYPTESTVYVKPPNQKLESKLTVSFPISLENIEEFSCGGYTLSSLGNERDFVEVFEEETYKGTLSLSFERETGVWQDFCTSSSYSGGWSKNKLHGEGTYTSKSWTYSGSFHEGKFDGKGTMVWEDGKKYVGHWKEGKKFGRGRMTWKDGRRYDGMWENGKPHGDGTFVDQMNNAHIGMFKNGALERARPRIF